MRIPCPVCSTVIKATEQHVGVKNRCVQCGTKFIIPASEEEEIEIIERGEDPGPIKPGVTKVQLVKPASEGLGLPNPKTPPAPATPKTPRPPRKLITTKEPLGRGVRTNVPSRALFKPPTPTPGRPGTETPTNKIPAKKKVPRKAGPKRPKHSLEHIPALAPEKEGKLPETEKLTPASLPKRKKPPARKTEALADRDEAKPRKKTAPVLQTGTGADRPLTGGARGSFHDLKVKRTQKSARQIIPAIVVGGVVLIGGLILISKFGSGVDRPTQVANNPVGNHEEIVRLGPEPALTPSTTPEPDVPETTVVTNQWKDVIAPMIEHYCLDCHDEANEEGGLEMERFSSESIALSEPEHWEKAAALIEMREMPPRDRFDQLTSEERQQFLAWVRTVSERWDTAEFGRDPGRTTIRRLTKNEFNYTIRDLFGLKIRPADNFPEDGGGEDGFDNNAGALFLPPLLMENIVEAAGLIVNAIYRDQATYRRYLFAFPQSDDDLDEASRKVLDYWTPLIYRRPVDAAEVDKLVALVRFQVDKKKKGYREAMKMPLLALLISPHFLYRSEDVKTGGKAYRVEEIDLASRLSYFLWSSTPDAKLLKLASEGTLSKPETYESQVKRMLTDKKANSLGMHFAGQWLKWEGLRGDIVPDKRRFPRFDFALRVAMYRESSTFFDHLVKENGSILDLIDSDYTFVNPRLAIHYDIPGVTKPGFRRVMLDDPNRGGVIGMGSILTATSLPLRSSPSIRGAYILTELLGTPPPPPPMNVPQLPEDDQELEFTSFREALVGHRVNPDCKACHETIDPIGFGLENYDAIGRWREYQNDKLVDSSGVLPDGTKFSTPQELKKILMQRKDIFARTMVRKTLSFALGRDLSRFDRQVVRSITDKLIASDYKIHTLFVEIARSYPFLNCRADDFVTK
jgi:hypothetical protein